MNGSKYAEIKKVLKGFLTEAEVISVLSRLPLTELTDSSIPHDNALTEASADHKRLLGNPVKKGALS